MSFKLQSGEEKNGEKIKKKTKKEYNRKSVELKIFRNSNSKFPKYNQRYLYFEEKLLRCQRYA